jgi:glycerophosphoryl diester phosphodiesterase
MIICHRGIIREKENQYESLIGIKEIRDKIPNVMYGVEFDIQLTRDNIIICYHDENLSRLHNIDSHIRNMDYSDMIKYNIPLFEDIIKELEYNSDFFMDIELKSYGNMETENIKMYCNNVISKINDVRLIDNIVLTSFSINIVIELLNSNLSVGLIVDKLEELDIDIINNLISNGLKYIIVNKNMVNDILKRYDSLNSIKILVYTFFNDISEEDQDISLINNIKSMNNISFITDDYNKLNNVFNS